MLRLISLVMVFIGTASDAEMEAHYIDVGQADATLLKFPCGTILIDAGAQNQRMTDHLVQYLVAEVPTSGNPARQRIDQIFITHNHVDHTLALREVFEEFEVGVVIENGERGGYPLGDEDIEWVAVNHAGSHAEISNVDVPAGGLNNDVVDRLDCPDTDPIISVLSSDHAENPGFTEGDFDNKNNHSLVVLVEYGESSFLFTGDLERKATRLLAERYPSLRAGVYQSAHHGAETGDTPELLSTIRPLYGVISAGHHEDRSSYSAWDHGHPRAKVVGYFKQHVQRSRTPVWGYYFHEQEQEPVREAISKGIYATGWDGHIVFTATSDGTYSVKTTESETLSNTPSNEDCKIKGNISRSSGKIYHIPSGQHYEHTTIDTSRGERWFCTEEDAEAAGWRKSLR